MDRITYIRLAILNSSTLPWLIARIGPASVPQRAHKIHHAPRRADRRHRVFLSPSPVGSPSVAARYYPRRAVRRGVIVQSNHDRRTEVKAGTHDLDESIICVISAKLSWLSWIRYLSCTMMQILRLLSRIYTNSMIRRQVVSRVQEVIVQAQNPW